MNIKNCRECHQQLTDEELKYYEDRCEQCESEWAEAIQAWRFGAKNPELDKLYGTAPSIIH